MEQSLKEATLPADMTSSEGDPRVRYYGLVIPNCKTEIIQVLESELLVEERGFVKPEKPDQSEKYVKCYLLRYAAGDIDWRFYRHDGGIVLEAYFYYNTGGQYLSMIRERIDKLFPSCCSQIKIWEVRDPDRMAGRTNKIGRGMRGDILSKWDQEVCIKGRFNVVNWPCVESPNTSLSTAFNRLWNSEIIGAIEATVLERSSQCPINCASASPISNDSKSSPTVAVEANRRQPDDTASSDGELTENAFNSMPAFLRPIGKNRPVAVIQPASNSTHADVKRKKRKTRIFDQRMHDCMLRRSWNPKLGDWSAIEFEFKTDDPREKPVQKTLWKEIGGRREVPVPHGFIDILTDTEVCEVKIWNDYGDALTQVKRYANYYPGRRMRIHFFGEVPMLKGELYYEKIMDIFMLLRNDGVLMTYEGYDWE